MRSVALAAASRLGTRGLGALIRLRPRSLLTLVLGSLITLALGSLSAQPARAEAEPPSASQRALVWKWRHAPALEYAATGLGAVGAVAAFYLLESQQQPRWNSAILFDAPARRSLRLRDPGARDTARSLSDVTGILTLIVAIGVDSIALPLARAAELSTLAEILLIDAQALVLTSLATTVTFDHTGRARPSYDDCMLNPGFDPLCNSGVTTSFFSGHTSQAFTAAGLSCAHHQYLELYGDPLLDLLSCLGSLAVAGATGTLRILGDRHYASDVVTGALVGFGFGYGVPLLLHYAMPLDGPSVTIAPLADTLGVNMAGKF